MKRKHEICISLKAMNFTAAQLYFKQVPASARIFSSGTYGDMLGSSSSRASGRFEKQ